MHIRHIADAAIDDDRGARCLWVPVEHWTDFCEAVGRSPNRIGVVIYRNKTVRPGPPGSFVTTRREDVEDWD